MDWASLKITKFSKCQTGPPLKSSLDGGNSPESPLNWILGEAQSGTEIIVILGEAQSKYFNFWGRTRGGPVGILLHDFRLTTDDYAL